MSRLYVILILLLISVSSAMAVTCPSGTSALSDVDASTFVATDASGACPPGYSVYNSPSHLSAYFSGTVLPDAPTLCGPGEYRNNGVCASYPAGGRCESNYITSTTSGATVAAPDGSGYCAPGYSATTVPTGSYIISTGTVVSDAPTLCGAGEYKNNGVCTSYDNTGCPTGWINATTSNTLSLVPTSAGTCASGYVASSDLVDCGERGNESFCGAFCSAGESLTWGGACVSLCGAGVTEFHVGSLVFPIYASKTTDHAIYLRREGGDTVCYVNLAAGVGTGALNVNIPTVGVYHTTR